LPEIRAAGFVLFRREGDRVLYLLLRNARHGDVGLPKGHAEPGEEAEATARRELFEETGIAPADIAPKPHFRRSLAYPIRGGRKEVVYFLAESARAEITRSHEHDHHEWLGLDAALGAIRHGNLREVVWNAGIHLKDPSLRRGLSPAGARALLLSLVGAEAPVVGHTAVVASAARRLAGAWGGLDPDYVESCAWIHDIGRSRTHGPRHPLEGFRIALEEGYPGYAPPCISHFTKGAGYDALRRDDRADPGLVLEMFQACDLETFPPEEMLVSLADSLAVGARLGTIGERFDDLVARYGPSTLVARNRLLAESHRADFESRTSLDLYRFLGSGGLPR